MLGTNDARDATFDEKNITKEYSELIKAYNSSKVFVVVPPPVIASGGDNFRINPSLVDKLPALVAEVAKANGVTFVDAVRNTFCQTCDCHYKGACDYFSPQD